MINNQLKPLILFGISKPNVYSFASLLGALELHRDLLEKYEILTFRGSIFNLNTDSEVENKYKFSERPFIILPFSLFTSQLNPFKNFIDNNLEKLKILNKNIFIIAGGWHCTGSPAEVINSGANYVIKGEAEVIFPNFLKDFHSNFFKGIITDEKSTNSKILQGDLSDLVNLNDFPPYSEEFRVFSPIEISRGCHYKCKFCQTGNYYGYMRHADIETIVRWVEKAVKIQYDRVWFTSPNAFAYGSPKGVGTNPKAVKDLLSRIQKIPNLQEIFFGTFPSEVRPEFVTKEMMEVVKPYISNKYFSIGAQTASDALLKKINRGHNFTQVLEAVDLIIDYGYGVDIDFIFRLPGENEEDITLTIEYFKEVLKS
ncbi:MAG: TIGR04013 family B12-binding domain/radical SAM domain-containing protein, partial [archaeon]|nr:TIGR04013 family B12-binding domain/radical SAM domain-containing protein [archaeon]